MESYQVRQIKWYHRDQRPHDTWCWPWSNSNRVASVRIAIDQAKDRLDGAVLASDAFFPFADNVEEIAKAGIKLSSNRVDQSVTKSQSKRLINMV